LSLIAHAPKWKSLVLEGSPDTVPSIDRPILVATVAISVGLVIQIPSDVADAIRKSQRHAGVVGSLPGLKSMWTAAAIAGHLEEAAR